MSILGVGLALLMIGGIVLGVPTLFYWIILEHATAGKYRQLVRLAEHQKKLMDLAGTPEVTDIPQWAIEYQEGRTIKTLVVNAQTEVEALRVAIKNAGMRYDRIIKTRKVG